jgi:hypothetical protein
MPSSQRPARRHQQETTGDPILGVSTSQTCRWTARARRQPDRGPGARIPERSGCHPIASPKRRLGAQNGHAEYPDLQPAGRAGAVALRAPEPVLSVTLRDEAGPSGQIPLAADRPNRSSSLPCGRPSTVPGPARSAATNEGKRRNKRAWPLIMTWRPYKGAVNTFATPAVRIAAPPHRSS